MAIQKHPTGFYKIVLLSLFGYRLRLHYWPHGAKDSRPDIHDHKWSFISLPLFGSFIERRYIRMDGATYNIHLCRSTTLPLEEVGESGIKQVSENIRRPFRPYLCRHGEIHDYQPVGYTKSASLVITGRPQKIGSNVWHENLGSSSV
jgi:hypothetical protein